MLFVTLLFHGCVNPIPNQEKTTFSLYHDSNLKNGKFIQHIPELNTINVAEVGENIYEKQNLYFYDTKTVQLKDASTDYISDNLTLQDIISGKNKEKSIEVQKNAALTGMINNFVDNITPNSITTEEGYIKSKKVTINDVLRISNDKKMYALCGFKMNEFQYGEYCFLDLNKTGTFNYIFDDYYENAYKLVKPVPYYTKRTPPTFVEDSFKYLVLYQGKIGNQIKVSFREFKDNLARPAFTQDIEYEINSNGTTMIGFKGLRIEVLDATNISIKYKVVQDYK